MDRTSPRALRSLTALLVIIAIVISPMVVMISLDTGYIPSWAFGILIDVLIVLMMVRLMAMVDFGYPPYDLLATIRAKRRVGEKEKVK